VAEPHELGPLTKVSVNFTARSVIALDAAAANTGESRTDTINRAVQLYAAVVAGHAGGFGSARHVITDTPGAPMRVEVNRPRWRFW
jgi:hypothetical protein